MATELLLLMLMLMLLLLLLLLRQTRAATIRNEKVERQGGQNQLYERMSEMGVFQKKLKEKTERKLAPENFGQR